MALTRRSRERPWPSASSYFSLGVVARLGSVACLLYFGRPAAAARCPNSYVPSGSAYDAVTFDPTCAAEDPSSATAATCVTDSCRLCHKSCRKLHPMPEKCETCKMVRLPPTVKAEELAGTWYVGASSPHNGIIETPAPGCDAFAFAFNSSHNVTLLHGGGLHAAATLFDPDAAMPEGPFKCTPMDAVFPTEMTIIARGKTLRARLTLRDDLLLMAVRNNRKVVAFVRGNAPAGMAVRARQIAAVVRYATNAQPGDLVASGTCPAGGSGGGSAVDGSSLFGLCPARRALLMGDGFGLRVE
ncbi:unnamed protein product [Phaeothamnion confervicola]